MRSKGALVSDSNVPTNPDPGPLLERLFGWVDTTAVMAAAELGVDWVMMASVSGQERTEAEYAALLESAGFRLTRLVPSESPMRVVEALPV
jgi:hypothetical protein